MSELEPAETGRSQSTLWVAVIGGAGLFGGLLALIVVVVAGGTVGAWKLLSPQPVSVASVLDAPVDPADTDLPADTDRPADTDPPADTDAPVAAEVPAHLGHPDPAQRIVALQAAHEDPTTTAAVLGLFHSDPDAGVREHAFEALVGQVEQGVGDPALQAAGLTEVLLDKAPFNQRKAANAYGRVGSDYGPLAHVLQRGSPTARNEAIRAAVEIAERTNTRADAKAMLESSSKRITSKTQVRTLETALEDLAE